MATVTRLGSADGRLCGVLAAAIAHWVTRPAKNAEPGRTGAEFYHCSMSSFEHATVVLRDLGVLEPLPRADKPNETWYCEHALTIDADAMPDHLADRIGDGDARLAHVIECFVGLACDVGEMSDERAAFVPPACFRDAMQALSRAGYADRTGDGYRWTDKIGPAMQANYLWDEKLRSHSTLARDSTAAEAEFAWRTMPETIRNAYFSHRPVTLFDLTKVVARCWRDEKWQPHAGGDSMRVGEAKQLAERLIEIASGRA